MPRKKARPTHCPFLLRVFELTRATSQDTVDRATSTNVVLCPTDAELVRSSDVILSVIPPRDVNETAQRVVTALADRPADRPLYFADMNAIAPSTVREVAHLFQSQDVRFIDGCIIGGPPSFKADTYTDTGTDTDTWDVPAMYASGPHKLADEASWGAALTSALNMRHIGADVGSASGLKMCFASMSKGYTALAIQSFTSAQKLGVLGDLQSILAEMMPARAVQTEKSLVGMAPKAYRWVREMEEISKTHAEEGGFDPDIFRGAAGVYRAVAEDTVLGQEKIGKRKRGTTGEDVARAMVEGLERKRARARHS